MIGMPSLRAVAWRESVESGVALTIHPACGALGVVGGRAEFLVDVTRPGQQSVAGRGGKLPDIHTTTISKRYGRDPITVWPLSACWRAR
jgi:hypothetical protein